MYTEQGFGSECRLAEKGKKADKYELAALGEAVGGKKPLDRFNEEAKEMPLLEFYSRAMLVCSDLDNTEYDLMSQLIIQSMRETAWENWRRIRRPEKSAFLEGRYDDEILARWPVIDQSGIGGGRVNLFDKAALELGIVLPRHHYISWLNNEGLLTDPPGNFDSFCRLVSLQADKNNFEQALTVNEKASFSNDDLLLLGLLGRNKEESLRLDYQNMTDAQIFLLRRTKSKMPREENGAVSGYAHFFKSFYQEVYENLVNAGVLSEKECDVLFKTDAAWKWVKENWNLREMSLAEAARKAGRGTPPPPLVEEEPDLYEILGRVDERPVGKPADEEKSVEPAAKEETPDWLEAAREIQKRAQLEPGKPAEAPVRSELVAVEGQTSPEIKILQQRNVMPWASHALQVTEENGQVKIALDQLEFPSSNEDQDEANLHSIKVEDQAVTLVLEDKGRALLHFRDITNPMSYSIELNIDSEVDRTEIKAWLTGIFGKKTSGENALSSIDGLTVNMPFETSSIILEKDGRRYFVGVTAGNVVRISWFVIQKGDYQKVKPEQAFGDICEITGALVNSWLGLVPAAAVKSTVEQKAVEKTKMPPIARRQ